MQMGHPIDSNTLMHRFDLSASTGYQVQIKFYDFVTKQNLDEFSLPRVQIENCPNFDAQFLSSSTVANYFKPEFTLSKFRKTGLKRSRYTELLRHLSKSGFDLYFSGILQFESGQNGQIGEGLISVFASIPEYNILFEHLESNKFI